MKASTHSNLDAAYRAGTALPAAHPDVAKAFVGLLPAGHPAIGPLLGNPSATPLPAWHPPLDQMVTRINFGNPAATVLQQRVTSDFTHLQSPLARLILRLAFFTLVFLSLKLISA